jgi:hypothetical protein
MWQILIGYFVYNAAGNARRQTEIVERLRGVSVRQLMRTPAPALPDGVDIHRLAANTVTAEQSAVAALQQLMRGQRSDALVLADGKAVGVIGARDIFAFLNRQGALRAAPNGEPG